MILKWLREGKTTTEIAKLLGVSIEESARLIVLFAGKRESWERKDD